MLTRLWYSKHTLRWCLWPFSWIYILISHLRRIYFILFNQKKFKTPIVVVGNITVGGVGKTPLVIALVENITARGLKVGVVSRGYGARLNGSAYEVKPIDNAVDVGDEPLLIVQKTGCPVVIARNRCEAVRYLENVHAVDIIVSDDGLQHYAMGRSIEIAVIDGTRGLGNSFCLPAGPLRERASRLKQVDLIVVNGGEWDNAYSMLLKPIAFKQLSTDKSVTADALPGNIAAVAAIGNPQRFFNSLTALGLQFTPYIFPDHYRYTSQDLNLSESTLLMTEKDAVKCRSFAKDSMYYLAIEAVLSEGFWDAFWSHKQLRGIF
jgi:tetraacyldisaccharide 4'-kinase